jgi:hypothetical protein
MSDLNRSAPQDATPRPRGDCVNDLDHPQAQAAQLPGGGGAPETGSPGEFPPEEVTSAGQQEG